MWTTLVATLGKFILGGGLNGIAKEIRQARLDKLNAENDEQRLEADERLETLKIRQSIILQAQKDKFERWIRILFALPFVIYEWKLVVWDKVLGWGTTEPLSPTLEYILWTVLAGYFVEAGIKKFKG